MGCGWAAARGQPPSHFPLQWRERTGGRGWGGEGRRSGTSHQDVSTSASLPPTPHPALSCVLLSCACGCRYLSWSRGCREPGPGVGGRQALPTRLANLCSVSRAPPLISPLIPELSKVTAAKGLCADPHLCPDLSPVRGPLSLLGRSSFPLSSHPPPLLPVRRSTSRGSQRRCLETLRSAQCPRKFLFGFPFYKLSLTSPPLPFPTATTHVLACTPTRDQTLLPALFTPAFPAAQ